MLQNKLRQKFNSKDLVLGILIGVGSTDIVDLIACAGFDYAVLDTEHCTYDLETLKNMLTVAESRGMCTQVRIGGPDPYMITKVLDIGPDSLKFSRVRNKEEAEEIVRLCRLPPLGTRSPEPATRSAFYGQIPMAEYTRLTNDTLIVLGIDTREGLDNLNEIVKVDGVDALQSGPSDLSWSLGVERGGPECTAAQMRIWKAALDAGKQCIANMMAKPERLKDCLKEEPRLHVFHWSADRLQILNALKAGVDTTREAFKK